MDKTEKSPNEYQREQLGKVAYETCGRSGIELDIRSGFIPWDEAQERDKEVGRRIAEAVVAAYLSRG